MSTLVSLHDPRQQHLRVLGAGWLVPFVLYDQITGGSPVDGTAVWALTQAGADLTRISNRGNSLTSDDFCDPEPSPDRTKIVFSRTPIGAGSANVYIVDVDTPPNAITTLDTNPSTLVTSMQPWWKPDGSLICYRTVDDSPNECKIKSVTPDGVTITTLKTISRTLGNIYRPQYSPSGSFIAYGLNKSPNSEIYVMNADGSGTPTLVATGTGISAWQCGVDFAWAHNSDVIAYEKGNGANTEFRKVNANGTGDTLLYTDTTPWWSLTKRPWTASDDALIFFRRDLGADPRFRLYRIAADGSGAAAISPDRTSYGGTNDSLAYVYGSRIYWREDNNATTDAIIVSCAFDGSDKRTEFDCSPPPSGFTSIRWSGAFQARLNQAE